MPSTHNLAILVFDDVEVLDFCGPFEIFSVANRFADPPALSVMTVAEKTGPVVTRGGLHVVGRLLGHEVAGKTARQMEYPWNGKP